MITYLNVKTGAVYRLYGFKAYRLMKGEWKRSTVIKGCDLAHYPFIGLRSKKDL